MSPGQAAGQGLALFAVLIAVVGNIAVFTTSHIRIDRNQREIRTLNSVLISACQRRDALDRQIRSTAQLLKATRGDPTIFGFPRTLIIDMQRQNRLDRVTLRILDCQGR